jgi:anti-anti-sigma factor
MSVHLSLLRIVQDRSGVSIRAVRGDAPSRSILYIDGAFRAPLTAELRHTLRTMLRAGERAIVVDLSGVSKIDAAGIGQLVRAYNMTVAVDGELRIVRATAWVRHILERVRLFDVLTGRVIDA